MGTHAMRWMPAVTVVVLVLGLAAGGCARRDPPVARPAPPPPPGAPAGTEAPSPPDPLVEPAIMPSEPVLDDDLSSRSLDELNRESPLEPVFFGFDSSEVDPAGQRVLEANAELLRRYPGWMITIEGHCDERGTAEYNLSLGERRALAARTYLLALGIPAERVRTVSYGKEFPFDPGSNEEAWARNRRAHFVITAQ